ncbi:MAG: tetratricopeptide repeat protein [Verrucomicrobia bacterium]|nr:tetratricopeptide repeat protein [Verrucomicrobiota bacterium]
MTFDALPAGVLPPARATSRLTGTRTEKPPRSVSVRVEEMVIPTYLPAAPDKNPSFLERRVYQGSSGKVYPLPFTDRIAETKTDRKWKAVWLENEYLRVLILPELGGRIHALQDKTNGYDLIYRQPVIKPALVGLAGPWISGGIELNWPQHHRPATFLPVDFHLEAHRDGSKTVWCSDHDPMCRMKGMHGVCLYPGRALVELKVRAYNRTPFVQTFLWWANVATRVHEAYRSFFPPDVYYVADHARRALSEYPRAQGFYYGVNYGQRGRQGVPPHEMPRRFVPPHGRESQITDHASRIPDYAPNDLSFYANLPTPCSFMSMGSQEDFFGGYDYQAQAGIVHLANHHIAPGKKQWTWGNHEFGYAWDRNLTDPDAQGIYWPYIEIMAGVYADNQPDFSFLQPGETKAWSQFWYPIQKIGPAQHANLRAAVALRVSRQSGNRPVRSGTGKAKTAQNVRVTTARLGISTTQKLPGATIELAANGKTIFSVTRDLAPGAPFVEDIKLPQKTREADLAARVTDATGREMVAYQPKPHVPGPVPPPATEPPPPERIASADELFLIGLHLEQYRHATRCPTAYWREALRRDPLDSRCNNALGRWHLRRGEWIEAENSFRQAIARLTRRNANPYDGEAFYNLGLCLRYQLEARRHRMPEHSSGGKGGRVPPLPGSTASTSHLFDEAYAAFYKATWNQAWTAAGLHALAEMDCRRNDWLAAREHLHRALRCQRDHLRARDLLTLVLRKSGQTAEAETLLRETLALDPLDWWARYLDGGELRCDWQTRLDLAHDFARAGFYAAAVELLQTALAQTAESAGPPVAKAAGAANATPHANPATGATALPNSNWGALPMVLYTLGWLQDCGGDHKSARGFYQRAAAALPDYCFPARLEEILILESAMRANPADARAPYYLGNLLYDRRRHAEAIRLWERSAELDSSFSIVWRNLGIGYFNVARKPARARAAYDRAHRANPADARLLYERDQLWKRLGEKPEKRLRELEKFPQLSAQRDDVSVEMCALYNQTGQPAKALEVLTRRKFQPWEGGEGAALGEHVRTRLALGRHALKNAANGRRSSDLESAIAHFKAALAAPENLGEAKHLLANQGDIHYWLGRALELRGETSAARAHWLAAAKFKGDFQHMSTRAFSELTFYSALAWELLGRKSRAKKLFLELLAYARRLQQSTAEIDYFATSLPALLLFADDPQFRQETTARFLQAQARLGLGQRAEARRLLTDVLRRDPNHPRAADLLHALR